MCQISVVFEREGNQETVMENVTRLEIEGNGIVLTSFFEEPKKVPDVTISHIDFLGGKVFLCPNASASGSKTD